MYHYLASSHPHIVHHILPHQAMFQPLFRPIYPLSSRLYTLHHLNGSRPPSHQPCHPPNPLHIHLRLHEWAFPCHLPCHFANSQCSMSHQATIECLCRSVSCRANIQRRWRLLLVVWAPLVWVSHWKESLDRIWILPVSLFLSACYCCWLLEWRRIANRVISRLQGDCFPCATVSIIVFYRLLWLGR